ncbi:MAG: 3-phosphoshikimate 1-carboxyvinyltransferase [Alphaproteobacteria bacterium]|nr:3-phosphoshikimate 1-carboxyvinyltransferase [Alphaproteobacteria bacterium]
MTTTATPAQRLRSARSPGLRGRLRVPGDKSISHRALILGGLSLGRTTVEGLLEGDDVLRTAAAMRQFGAEVSRLGEGRWQIVGRGVGGLAEPAGTQDLGNSGTGVRLLMGVAAGHGFTTFFTGDQSLCRRPMGRITAPLALMGASFLSRAGERLPLAVTGSDMLVPIDYVLPVASAQVKSAVLLAGLHGPGRTTVVEPAATRDHTERMLRHFGAGVRVEESPAGRRISVEGQGELRGCAIRVPADPSSAAFFAVAAAITAGSELTLEAVGVNPLRAGLFQTLRDMGADLVLANERDVGGEPVADITVRSSALRGIEVPPERAPSMIDEYPVLAIAAAFAGGRTTMRGLAELRVKESDRLRAVARGLTACGVAVTELDDGLVIEGGHPAGGADIVTEGDHRIAMAFLVCGMAATKAITVDEAVTIGTSFPGFADLANAAGGRLSVAP